MRNVLKGSLLAMSMAVAACNSTSLTDAPLADLTPRASGGTGGGGGGGGGNGGGGNNGGGATTTISFLTTVEGAPSLAENPTSFYAVQGVDRIAEIWYLPQGRGNAKRFLRFKVRKDAQIVRPDGSLLAPGDSILITMDVIDPTHLITEFAPSGLRFTGKGSAELTMWYLTADDDLNHDGVVNSTDSAIANTLSIFRQESANDPWIKVPSVVSPSAHSVFAVINGFTNYVIAY